MSRGQERNSHTDSKPQSNGYFGQRRVQQADEPEMIDEETKDLEEEYQPVPLNLVNNYRAKQQTSDLRIRVTSEEMRAMIRA